MLMAVDSAAAPPSTREQPTTPLWRRYAGLLAVAAGLAAAAVAGLAHLTAVRSIPQPAGIAEATVAANAYGLNRLGGFQVPDSLSDRVLSVHLALYNELTNATARQATAAGALRELLLVSVVAGALALFTLCRQLGLGTPTAAGVVLLAYVPPAIASAQELAYAATVATTWLLIAAIMFSARPTATPLTWLARALGGLLILLATLIAPVALLLAGGVLAVAVATGTLFPGWGTVRRVLTVGAALVVMAAAGAAGFDSPGAGQSVVEQSTVIAVAVAGLILAAVATWLVLWIRPLAVGCVPLLAAALVPWEQQASALVLALPVIAVLLGAIVEEALSGRQRPALVVRRGVAAALAAAAAVGVLALPASATDAVGEASQAELAAWLMTNTAPETRLQVDTLLWVELVRSGVPPARLQRTDAMTSGVSPAVLVAERGARNAASSLLVARFGEGPFVVDIRQRVTDAVSTQTAVLAEKVASQTFGSALASNPNLTLADSVGGDLEGGNVDSRLLTVLATAAAGFTFTIDAFPRTNGADEAGMLRTVRISEIGALEPAGETADALLLRDFFRYQLQPYRPLSQGFDAGVLVVVYSAPSPIGLLS